MADQIYFRLLGPQRNAAKWTSDFASYGPAKIDALDFVTASYRVPGMTLKRILWVFRQIQMNAGPKPPFSESDLEFVWSYLYDNGYFVPLTEEEIKKLPKIRGLMVVVDSEPDDDDPITDDTPIEWA